MEYLQPVRGGIGQLFTPQYDHSATGAPSVDHTTNSEKGTYFLFMNRYSFTPTTYIDTLTIMDIEPDRSTDGGCVRFAYQKYGNATLKVMAASTKAYTYYYQYGPILWTAKQ